MTNPNQNRRPPMLPEDDFLGEATELVSVDSLMSPTEENQAAQPRFGGHPPQQGGHDPQMGGSQMMSHRHPSQEVAKQEATQMMSVTDFQVDRAKRALKRVSGQPESEILIGDGRNLQDPHFGSSLQGVDSRGADPRRAPSGVHPTVNSAAENRSPFADGADFEEATTFMESTEVTGPGLNQQDLLRKTDMGFAGGLNRGADPQRPSSGPPPRTPPMTPGGAPNPRIQHEDDEPESTAIEGGLLSRNRPSDVHPAVQAQDPGAAQPMRGGAIPPMGGSSPEDKINAIVADQVLAQQYNFMPDSIKLGEVTLIFGQNKLGAPVVLRQIWDGDPAQIPQEIQERIQKICAIPDAHLIKPTHLFAAETGGWAEFLRPPGFRLSDVIRANGPQDPELVKKWMIEAANILNSVHQSGVAYANLTPDAIWVQENGPLLLEPFDVLSFEGQSNLGLFAPQELQMSQGAFGSPTLSPSTDVYGLCAVALAALTGIPLDLTRRDSVPDPFKTVLAKGLLPNPAERYQSTQEFVDGLAKSSDKIFGLDRKVALAIVALVAMLGIATIFMDNSSPAPAGPAPVTPVGEPENAVAAPPGPVKRYSVIHIETSYVINPPATPSDSEAPEGGGDAESLAALLDAEKENAQFGSSDEDLDKIREAVGKWRPRYVTDLKESNWEAINKVSRMPEVAKAQQEQLGAVQEAVADKNISAFAQSYPDLAAVDAAAINPDLIQSDSWQIVEVANVKKEEKKEEK